MGRHSEYTKEIGDEICDRISSGEPLAQICLDQHMPAVRTVSDWKAANPQFAADFAHARITGFHAIAERSRLTARGKTHDEGGDSTGDVVRDKLIIETDLKLLAKWFPAAYGDRTTVSHEGDIGVAMTTISNKERAKALAALLAKNRNKVGDVL